MTAKERADALKELNAPLTHQEIRNAIDSFKKYSAAFEDEFAVLFLQRGRDVLAEVLRICYNGMWIFETRPVELNWRIIKVIPKSGKPKTEM